MTRITTFILVAVIGSLAACERGQTPPHIVLIVADDMGYGDPGVYNADSRIPTPHIDGLAAEGMRFTDAHSPSGVCTPTRYGLLTGRYAWRLPALEAGVTQGYDPLIVDTARVTMASLLREAGYSTAAIGKWHLGLGSVYPTDYYGAVDPGPRALGFDYFYGIPASLDMPPYVWIENERAVQLPTDSTHDTMPCCIGAFWRGGRVAPDFDHADVLPAIRDGAVRYIRDHAGGGPFFLYVALAAPHTPWLPLAPHVGSSGAGEYGDFAAQVDGAVGAIASALQEAQIADETLVVFTSDNGAYWRQEEIDTYGHRANHTWRGMKADIYEGGHRIPLIVRWPRSVVGGASTDQLTVLTDLMATFADAAKVPLPAGAAEDSFSLLDLLTGTAETSARGEAVHQSSGGMLALRQGPWKFIDGQGSGGFTHVEIAPTDPAGQLYHLGDDPAEERNLIETHPEKALVMQSRLLELRERGRSRP